jgi:hypothetical protein
MKQISNRRPVDKTIRSLRHLLKWVPKTTAERSRENRELDEISEQMKLTISGLSTEMQAEINGLTGSGHPREAEEKPLSYLVEDDPFTQLRKEARRGTGADERRMDDRVWIISVVPVLVALYFIFSVLWNSHGHIH